MAKAVIVVFAIAGILSLTVGSERSAAQTSTNDATLSDLRLRSTADTGSGTQNLGLFGIIGAAIAAPLAMAMAGEELPLAPTFQPDVHSYTVTVPYNMTSVQLLATTNHSGASAEAIAATADGKSLQAGMSMDGIELSLPGEEKLTVDIARRYDQVPVGSSVITIDVTSEDGADTRTYSVALSRSAPDLEDTMHRDSYFRESLVAGNADGISDSVEAGVHVNQQLEVGAHVVSPLFVAVYGRHQEIVSALLQAGADVDVGVHEGNSDLPSGTTPLIVATQRGDEGIVRLLIDAGANVNYVVPDLGTTALLLAARDGSETLIRLMINAGADVTYALPNGMTALLMAVQREHVDVARLLVDAGADINAVLSEPVPGISVLMVATATGSTSLVRLLIGAGVDVDYEIPDREGATALRVAVGQEREEIAKLLRQAGATR